MAPALDLTYEVVPIDEIRTHPDNPRRGDLDRLGASIARNGFFAPCIVQRSTGLILAGNHRWLAAKAQGLTEVPAVFVDVDQDQARRIMVADNRMSDVATYDESALAALLGDIALDPEGLAGTGFSEDDLARLIPDAQPAAPPDGSLDERKVHECPSCGYMWTLGVGGTVEPA